MYMFLYTYVYIYIRTYYERYTSQYDTSLWMWQNPWQTNVWRCNFASATLWCHNVSAEARISQVYPVYKTDLNHFASQCCWRTFWSWFFGPSSGWQCPTNLRAACGRRTCSCKWWRSSRTWLRGSTVGSGVIGPDVLAGSAASGAMAGRPRRRPAPRPKRQSPRRPQQPLPAPAAPAVPSSTSSTGGVCAGGNANGGQGQFFGRFNLDPPINTITINSAVTPPDCLCVGGTSGGTLVPGYLSVVAAGFTDPDGIGFFSITSPNGTELVLPAVSAEVRQPAATFVAGTVFFNGFSAVGDWTIKVLDGSGNLAPPNASLVILRFGLQNCNRIMPAAECFGNSFDGKAGFFYNRSLVGTTLSSTETAVQFHADLPDSCCLDIDGVSASFQFSNSPPLGQIVTAHGRSPEPGNADFTLTGRVQANNRFREVNLLELMPPIAGNPAAGLWNFNISTRGFDAVIGNELRDPRLLLRLQPCG